MAFKKRRPNARRKASRPRRTAAPRSRSRAKRGNSRSNGQVLRIVVEQPSVKHGSPNSLARDLAQELMAPSATKRSRF